MGRLAAHLAELPRWTTFIVSDDEVDLAAVNFTPSQVTNSDELLQSFEDHRENATTALQNSGNDEVFMKKWTLKHGDHVIFTLPKIVALRSMVLNHIIHHRAQLGVYLRLLDIPVPSVYGPTADEQAA